MDQNDISKGRKSKNEESEPKVVIQMFSGRLLWKAWIMLTKFFSRGAILLNPNNIKNDFTKTLTLHIFLVQLPWHRTWYFNGRNRILSIFFSCVFILFYEDEFFLFIYVILFIYLIYLFRCYFQYYANMNGKDCWERWWGKSILDNSRSDGRKGGENAMVSPGVCMEFSLKTLQEIKQTPWFSLFPVTVSSSRHHFGQIGTVQENWTIFWILKINAHFTVVSLFGSGLKNPPISKFMMKIRGELSKCK